MKRAYRWLAGVAVFALMANLSAQVEEDFCTDGADCVEDTFEVIFADADAASASLYGGALDVGTQVDTQAAIRAATAKIQGWSFGVAHDAAVMTLLEDSVTTLGTIAHPDTPDAVAIPPNFDVSNAVEGGYISAIVLSFLTETELPVGAFSPVCNANYTIAADPGASGTLLRFVDSEIGPDGSPKTAINLTVDGSTKLPSKFVQGQIGGGGGGGDEICDNGIDDNDNGLVDCDDPQCVDFPACQTEICDNQIDDNDNGLVDCDDPQCKGDPACDAPREICDNNIDDNNNGLVDCDDPECDDDPACVVVGECPDWAFFFGPTAAGGNYDASGNESFVISQRNKTDAFAMSLGAKVTEDAGSFNYEFSGELGADANRLIELIITGENGDTFTPDAGNTASADAAPVSIERGAALTGNDPGDFFAFDLAPGVGGPGFTIGYVADLSGDTNKVPATADDESCPVNEVFVIKLSGDVLNRFQRGDADGNGKITVSDAVWIIQIVVGNFTEAYNCDDALDANDDGAVNIADALPVLSWLFQRGPRLPEPFLACGTDSAAGCLEASPACN